MDREHATAAPARVGHVVERRQYAVRGIVQGVGFRPFVYRLALQRGVFGLIRNDVRGVTLDVEGTGEQLDGLVRDIASNAPPLAEVHDITLLNSERGPACYAEFSIASSEPGGSREVVVTPDAFLCDDCLRELFDAENRRHRYPFINCTNCGPRFSIVLDIPYDRAQTTMAPFALCRACAAEYGEPTDRRFHAQPNACWTCGPRARLLTSAGVEVSAADPIDKCANLLREGAVVAVKGIGGYHVMCDATNEAALRAIRERKHRAHKPFALMSESVAQVREYAHVSAAEAALLSSTERPIVLLRRREPARFSDLIAPGLRDYGVMLAYTPIHHLLLRGQFTALVATSANVTNEPITYRDDHLPEQLGQVVDYFLTHNRGIHTRIDDSIVRSTEGAEGAKTLIRRARGFTPKPVTISRELPCVLAVGGELKNTICVTKGRQLFLSQHVGDLKNYKNYEFFMELCDRLPRLLGVRPDVLACDLHPDFLNTRYAKTHGGVEVIPVQHHHAHLAACVGEHDVTDRVLGVTFDGMGYGLDGTPWGGEFLLGSFAGFQRVGHFRYLGLPGGDRAVREPFRIAWALLADALGSNVLANGDLGVINRVTPDLRHVLTVMIERGVNMPRTSSVGRLFDGVAALLGVRDTVTYEGQAAIELEQLARDVPESAPLSFAFERSEAPFEVDTRPMIQELVSELQRGIAPAVLASRFHSTLAEIVRRMALSVRRDAGVDTVALSGGVFLNAELLLRTRCLLEREGFRVLAHHKVPANDGGLAFGQALVAAAVMNSTPQSR